MENVETSKELWDTLEAKYMAEDASSKKFIVSNFTNYKMTGSRPVLEQCNKLIRIPERGGGAKRMLGEGILKNVDAIFGLHVSIKFPIGAVARRSDPLLATNGFFEAVINGKGGHAAIP
nr:IAA-amino acid hydrolase ILR1-like 4 [Tanacetum cinerariifolium]